MTKSTTQIRDYSKESRLEKITNKHYTVISRVTLQKVGTEK